MGSLVSNLPTHIQSVLGATLKFLVYLKGTLKSLTTCEGILEMKCLHLQTLYFLKCLVLVFRVFSVIPDRYLPDICLGIMENRIKFYIADFNAV